MDLITLQLLEKLIRANACNGVEISSGVLQIVFGSSRLIVQSSWRIVSDSEIVVASDSDMEQSEDIAMLLHNLSVDRVSVSTLFNDLELYFGSKALLQTFADSEKYEHWYFTSGPQEMIVAGPGKLWSLFKP